MFSRYIIIVFLFLFGCQSKNLNKTIYHNGKIWTGDTEQEWAEAFLIEDGIITSVGNEESIVELNPSAEKIDLEGKLVVPGLIDNHVHFISGGFQLASVNLREASSKEAFIQKLQDFASSIPAGRWIQGGDWDHEAWGGELPQKEWIDSVTTDNPIFVTRLDGHMGLANSKALALAGINNTSKAPEGGTIIFNKQGEPTGILKDEAMNALWNVIPEPSLDEEDEALIRASNHALENGITQVHDMAGNGWRSLRTYLRANERDQLQLRIYAGVPLSSWERMLSFVQSRGTGNGFLRWGLLKGFVDGSLGSTTAWFKEPYLDEPHTNGLVVTDTTQLEEWIIEADKAGFQLAIHAIGDQANEWLLDTFEKANQRNGKRDRRFRIEHAQHLSPELVPRFKDLNVIPSMQPYHAIDDGRWAEKRIGATRIQSTYPFKDLLIHGAKLTFGSDWTVAPISPLEGIYAAVTRQTLDGLNPEGWVSQQKITVEEALRSYTVNNAYAGFQEGKVGVIKKGAFADFIVLSEDIFSINPEQIKEVKVLRTVVNGIERFRLK